MIHKKYLGYFVFLILVGFPMWVVMGLFRLAFLFTFGDISLFPLQDILHGLFLGSRFDLVVVAYTWLVPLLLATCLAAFCWQSGLALLQKISRYWFALFYVSLLLVLIADFGFYSFFQDRLNVLIFGLVHDDTWALVTTVFKNYPVFRVTIGLIVIYWLTLKLCILAHEFSNKIVSSLQGWPNGITRGLTVAPLLLAALAARGTLAMYPLNLMDTAISDYQFINIMSFDGVHALYRAFEIRFEQLSTWNINLMNFGYGNNPQQAIEDWAGKPSPSGDPLDLIKHKTPLNPEAERIKPHVIFILNESWAEHWIELDSQYDSSMNLLGEMKKHLQEDYHFKNHLAGTGITIGSMSSLMGGVPHRPQGAFLVESEYMQTLLPTSPSYVFDKAGWQTRFIYGGNQGWRDINKYALRQNFKFAEGQTEIAKVLPDSKKEVHDWGVFDEFLYDYIFEKLKSAEKPEFIYALTTTNHPPYPLPSWYQPLPIQIPLQLEQRLTQERKLVDGRLKTFQYSNRTLGQFIQKIKDSPLGDKTIIAVTGDHPFWILNYGEPELIFKWAVPLYIYVPKALRPKHFNPDTFGGHQDIMSTLYNLAFSEKEYDSFGVNLFDPPPEHFIGHSTQFLMADWGGAQLSNDPKYFKWQGRDFVPGERSEMADRAIKKYKGLMGAQDWYLKEIKNRSQKNKP